MDLFISLFLSFLVFSLFFLLLSFFLKLSLRPLPDLNICFSLTLLFIYIFHFCIFFYLFTNPLSYLFIFLSLAMYTTPARVLAQKLCGWGFKSAQELEERLVLYEKRGRYSKAAALAVFHFNLKRALATFELQAQKGGKFDTHYEDRETDGGLSTKKSINVQLIAMALSGYKDGIFHLKKTYLYYFSYFCIFLKINCG